MIQDLQLPVLSNINSISIKGGSTTVIVTALRIPIGNAVTDHLLGGILATRFMAVRNLRATFTTAARVALFTLYSTTVTTTTHLLNILVISPT